MFNTLIIFQYSSGDLDDILLENTGFDDDMVETKISGMRQILQNI